MIKKLLIIVIFLSLSVSAFAQTVDTAWVRRYNGTGTSYNYARAVAVDHFGSVYVAGSWAPRHTQYYPQPLPKYDYAIVKYDSSGTESWVVFYNGPEDDTIDQAYDIAVDNYSNVYVTGSSGTVKYNTHGSQLWSGQLGGNVMTIDNFNNVYVTGISYSTAKYYPNGDTAWVRPHIGDINAIAADYSGNVYVTGTRWVNSSERYNFVTIKYDSSGNEVWVALYNGLGYLDDVAWDIVIDSTGNVYVTGKGYGLMATTTDYITIKYDANGNELWVREYNAPQNGDDHSRLMTIDKLGNVYVSGSTADLSGVPTKYDYTTIKYYPNGDTAWIRRYGAAYLDDSPTAICRDSSGNIYVTGASYNNVNKLDYVTVKYDPNGNEKWIQRYNGPGNGDDVPYAITADGIGNIYVTGGSYGGYRTNLDYATIKYVQTPNDVRDETGSRGKPSEFALSQNYPNPFNQSTKIEFTLAHSGFATLNIYDILGRKIRTLVSENLSPGYKSVLWDGKDDLGKEVASGIYFYQLKIGDFSEAKNLVLLK
jgi:hypothetical protein